MLIWIISLLLLRKENIQRLKVNLLLWVQIHKKEKVGELLVPVIMKLENMASVLACLFQELGNDVQQQFFSLSIFNFIGEFLLK